MLIIKSFNRALLMFNESNRMDRCKHRSFQDQKLSIVSRLSYPNSLSWSIQWNRIKSLETECLHKIFSRFSPFPYRCFHTASRTKLILKAKVVNFSLNRLNTTKTRRSWFTKRFARESLIKFFGHFRVQLKFWKWEKMKENLWQNHSLESGVKIRARKSLKKLLKWNRLKVKMV